MNNLTTKEYFDKMLYSCTAEPLALIGNLIPLLQFKKQLGEYYSKMNKSDQNLELFASQVKECNKKIEKLLGL